MDMRSLFAALIQAESSSGSWLLVLALTPPCQPYHVNPTMSNVNPSANPSLFLFCSYGNPIISLSTLTHNPPHFFFAVVADVEGVGGVL